MTRRQRQAAALFPDWPSARRLPRSAHTLHERNKIEQASRQNGGIHGRLTDTSSAKE